MKFEQNLTKERHCQNKKGDFLKEGTYSSEHK